MAPGVKVKVNVKVTPWDQGIIFTNVAFKAVGVEATVILSQAYQMTAT